MRWPFSEIPGRVDLKLMEGKMSKKKKLLIIMLAVVVVAAVGYKVYKDRNPFPNGEGVENQEEFIKEYKNNADAFMEAFVPEMSADVDYETEVDDGCVKIFLTYNEKYDVDECGYIDDVVIFDTEAIAADLERYYDNPEKVIIEWTITDVDNAKIRYEADRIEVEGENPVYDTSINYDDKLMEYLNPEGDEDEE